MNKAKITIEIEVPIRRLDKDKDKGLSIEEVVDIATGGILIDIDSKLKINPRKPKIIKAEYEHTYKRKVDY